MKKEVIVRLHASFEELVQKDEGGGEYWLARDLQELLGYAKWENFAKVIDKARTACQGSGYDPQDHFLDVRKMVELGSGATRAVDDIALTRYACYLIAQNGDPSKEAIAFAQTYFAVQTRKHELIEQRLAEMERLLVQDWYKDAQTQTKVRSEISRVLNDDLPATYDRALFEQKCAKVYDLVTEYSARGRKWAA